MKHHIWMGDGWEVYDYPGMGSADVFDLNPGWVDYFWVPMGPAVLCSEGDIVCEDGFNPSRFIGNSRFDLMVMSNNKGCDVGGWLQSAAEIRATDYFDFTDRWWSYWRPRDYRKPARLTRNLIYSKPLPLP
jgi:hypothetical protein